MEVPDAELFKGCSVDIAQPIKINCRIIQQRPGGLSAGGIQDLSEAVGLSVGYRPRISIGFGEDQGF